MRSNFVTNILLSFAWIALTGSFTFANFAFGFFISFGILWLVHARKTEFRYFVTIGKIVKFFFAYLFEMIKSNVNVAFHVLNPISSLKPGIVEIPLDAKTNLEITLLANMVMLTPGTLSMDVSTDRKVLYVHSMIIKDKQAFIDEIKTRYEKPLLEILR